MKKTDASNSDVQVASGDASLTRALSGLLKSRPTPLLSLRISFLFLFFVLLQLIISCSDEESEEKLTDRLLSSRDLTVLSFLLRVLLTGRYLAIIGALLRLSFLGLLLLTLLLLLLIIILMLA